MSTSASWSVTMLRGGVRDAASTAADTPILAANTEPGKLSNDRLRGNEEDWVASDDALARRTSGDEDRLLKQEWMR